MKAQVEWWLGLAGQLGQLVLPPRAAASRLSRSVRIQLHQPLLCPADEAPLRCNPLSLPQRVVPAQYAFVIHTKNPSTNDDNEIYCELVKGLGEAIVSGTVPGTALAFTAKKNDLDNPTVRGDKQCLQTLAIGRENKVAYGREVEGGWAGGGMGKERRAAWEGGRGKSGLQV